MVATNPKRLLAEIKTGITVAAGSLAHAAPSSVEAVCAVSYLSRNMGSFSQVPPRLGSSPIATFHAREQDSIGREINNRKHEPESKINRHNIRETDSDSAGCRNAQATGGHIQRSIRPVGQSTSSLTGFFTRGLHSEGASSGGNTSHWYIALKEDFDVIPLICYLAEKHPKCVCFISHCKTAIPYEPIFSEMLNRPVERPGKRKSSAPEAISNLETPGPQLLLLRGNKIEPPNFSEAEVDAVIHWGLPRTGHFISHIKSPKAKHTYLLLPEDEHSAVTDPVVTGNGLREHPKSTKLNAYGSESLLHSFRNRAVKVLSKMSSETLNKAYEDQFYQPGYSSVELAQRANKFAARVLLRGNPEDGSPVYKPTGPRLSVQSRVILFRNLKPAVDRDLLKVHD